MNLAEVARIMANRTLTENGAVAIKSTGNANLDLFGSIGGLRDADKTRIERLFAEAYKENPLIATKIAFYARDIREGLGERRVFRTIIRYMAENHSEAILPNIRLIGEYGRFDDLYTLVGTPVEDAMWEHMKVQFANDYINMCEGKQISLLAKWIKTADASSKETRRLGILTAHKLGCSVYEFKRIIRRMRRYIDVTEVKMTANEWSDIEYSEVPSRAMMIYENAFERHDSDRYLEFITKAVKGEVKINSSTLYPYDLINKYTNGDTVFSCLQDENKTIEALWRQLPNYVSEGTNAMVIADTSGSMRGRPINTAVGLAVYFAERNKGAYHNLWMSFSQDSKIHELKGETLLQKLKSINTSCWGSTTNLCKAFELILEIAEENNVSQDEMVKSIIVISDMEIDACSSRNWTFYEKMKDRFSECGYEIPNIIFWNVSSRHDVFHADAKREGVQLVSGQSTTVFKQVIDCIGMTPVEMMMKVIDSERYKQIRIAD